VADKHFSLRQARALLPKLKHMLQTANTELAEKQLVLQEVKQKFHKCEEGVDEADRDGSIDRIRAAREKFQSVIAELADVQAQYLQSFHFWISEIGNTGVILRDFHAGLLDFPSTEAGFEYLLCWRMDEDDINYWHPVDDGFAGRKPLSTLTQLA
jgi:hypothetical protein